MATAGRNDVRASTADGVRRGEWSGEQMYNLYVPKMARSTAGELNLASVYYETLRRSDPPTRGRRPQVLAGGGAGGGGGGGGGGARVARGGERAAAPRRRRATQEAKTAAARARARAEGLQLEWVRRGAAGAAAEVVFASAEAGGLVH